MRDMLSLKRLTQLKALDMSLCSLSDVTAVELLGSLAGLKSLRLWQKKWSQESLLLCIETDAILPVIKSHLQGLRDLDMDLPGISDASVELLEGLTQLTKLTSRLSGHSVDWLRQVLVGCQVTSTGLPW
jgi:Leucine-rich repeat (LRR) protein